MMCRLIQNGYTKLQKYAGQDDTDGCRGFHVCIREPGVDRKQRHLDGEREGECPEQPELQRPCDGKLNQVIVRERHDAELPVIQIDECDDRDQHQQRADERAREAAEPADDHHQATLLFALPSPLGQQHVDRVADRRLVAVEHLVGEHLIRGW